MTAPLDYFHFLRPWWFLALLPVLALCAGLWWSQSLAQQWQKYIAPHLLPFLLDQRQIEQKRWPILGLLLLWLCAVMALAGPVWQKIPVPVERSSSAVVICWDLSPSMLAEDVKPSRLVKSRLKIIDLLKSKNDGQMGLIAYSGEAYLVTPLTDDFQTIINLLPALNPTTLPTVGSNPEMAIAKAQQMLKDSGVMKGSIVLLTDDIAEDAMDDIVDLLANAPHQLTIWGIGTENGAPIPLPNGGFAKDSNGEIVVAKLRQDRLQDFARKAQVYYVPVISGDSDVETLNTLTDPNSKQTSKTERSVEQWFEHGQYLVLLLLPFAVLLFRRGLVFGLLLLPAIYSPESNAFSWNDLWQTQDQQAQAALDAGDDEAATQFSTAAKRGSVLFHQGKYEAASEQFTQQDSAELNYNLGTSLVHSGAYEEAIDAFNRALSKRPDFDLAQQNLEIAKQLLELAKKQEEKEREEQNQENQQGEQQGEQQDGEQQEQQGDQQNSSTQGKSQQQNSSAQNGQGEQTDASDQANQSSSADSAENPFATSKQQSSQASSDATAMSTNEATEEENSSDMNEQQKAAAIAQQAEEAPLTEEQQMLEQWLRKVPDDPSGLMRNKFKYQYLQRRQQLGDQFSSKQKQAEKRW